MCYEVPFDFIRLTEALPTHWTTEWFLPCVNPEVNLQMGSLIKPLSTEMALVRLLPRVNALVALQPPGGAERFTTQGAEERLLLSVDARMGVQVAQIPAQLGAHRATQRRVVRLMKMLRVRDLEGLEPRQQSDVTF